MALLSLMWHKFSIEFADHGRDFSGAVKRTTGFNILHDYKNRIGHLQHLRSATRREDIVLKYGIKSQEVAYILYHQLQGFEFLPGMRVLLNKNPRLSLEEFPTEENTDIYEFKGSPGEPIAHRSKVLLEVYLEKNARWEF